MFNFGKKEKKEKKFLTFNFNENDITVDYNLDDNDVLEFIASVYSFSSLLLLLEKIALEEPDKYERLNSRISKIIDKDLIKKPISTEVETDSDKPIIPAITL